MAPLTLAPPPRMFRLLAVLWTAALFVPPVLGAQSLRAAPMSPSALRARLTAFAHDSMRGRMTGTADHRRATAYIAAELRRLGLEPAGDSGSFLQRVPLLGTAFDTATTFNVVAILPGSDPVLRTEYVALGAHSDHVGVGRPVDRDSLRAFHLGLRRAQLAAGGRVTPEVYASVRVNMDSLRRRHPRPRLDSIYNGADDDGSGAMGLLEVARAMATERTRPRRSILFVWHTGEEGGLFGAEHFTDHPTVPRDRIVAQVNLDMIGRGGRGEEIGGGPRYLQLIGARRLSSQLGDVIDDVNRRGRYRWAFDYQYDAPGHPEQFYCRSDHYMYARYGIPVVFVTTGSHADYHQVTDEVQYIDFEKLARVTSFTRDLARAIADRPERLVVDHPRPNPRGTCIQ